MKGVHSAMDTFSCTNMAESIAEKIFRLELEIQHVDQDLTQAKSKMNKLIKPDAKVLPGYSEAKTNLEELQKKRLDLCDQLNQLSQQINPKLF